ncbi:TPA: helix-turn-helix domain-containing protein [Streptococcus suis]
MISYQPFYETLNKKDKSEYYLIKIEGISANTLYRMKKGESITTKTIDKLCEILECNVEDIIRYELTDK